MGLGDWHVLFLPEMLISKSKEYGGEKVHDRGQPCFLSLHDKTREGRGDGVDCIFSRISLK